MAAIEYYYCLTHRTVEPSDRGCRAVDRLGPYPDRESAEHALATVEQRNEDWENDPRWNDDDEDDES